jgi:hypothetical protein
VRFRQGILGNRLEARVKEAWTLMISCEDKGLLRPDKEVSAPQCGVQAKIPNNANRVHGLELNQEWASFKVPCI